MAEPIKTKTCRVCKQIKLLSEFYKYTKMLDNHLNLCKSCSLKQMKKYRQTERGKTEYENYQKHYRQSEKCKATFRAATKRYSAQYPNRIKAANAVNHAIRAGRLPRPDSLQCSCSKQAIQYHHPSYEPEHWLNIVPMCRVCHLKYHKNLNLISIF